MGEEFITTGPQLTKQPSWELQYNRLGYCFVPPDTNQALHSLETFPCGKFSFHYSQVRLAELLRQE
jgi:hypothetical protein